VQLAVKAIHFISGKVFLAKFLKISINIKGFINQDDVQSILNNITRISFIDLNIIKFNKKVIE
jgi:hypothetical protein